MKEKVYRKSTEESFDIETVPLEESPSGDPSRRDFLKLMGFSFAVSALSACSAPPKKVIPYLVKPEEVTPGLANWYASTSLCPENCGILVKSRDGRPIKAEGNRGHPVTKGGLCAEGQASVLSLYDSARLRGPKNGDNDRIKWPEIDTKIKRDLAYVSEKGGKVVLLSKTITSSATYKLIGEFGKQFSKFEHVMYDPVSVYAIRKAHQITFRKAVLPTYRIDRADLIVNFGADFLSTWIAPVAYTKQFSSRRKLKNKMSRLIQLESKMTLTGSNADTRIPVDAHEEGLALLWVLKLVSQNSTSNLALQLNRKLNTLPMPNVSRKKLQMVSDELWKNRRKSLVLSGANDVHSQVVVNLINELLGNYGRTVDLDNISYQYQGDDEAVSRLVREMNRGDIAALIVYGVNPVYTYPDKEKFISGLKNVNYKISFSDRLDETAERMDYVCPDHHPLESWNDAEATKNVYSLSQPLIAPLFKTRQAQDSLLKWSGRDVSYYDYLKSMWKRHIHPRQSRYVSFQSFWDRVVHDGVFYQKRLSMRQRAFTANNIDTSLASLANANPASLTAVLYEKAGVRDGRHANNPWLQELPDPVTKVTWDNYATVSVKLAKHHELKNGDIVKLQSGKGILQLPVFVLPGQAAQTIGLALGYGRKKAGRAGDNVGVDVYPWVGTQNGTFDYHVSNVSLEKTKYRKKLACTQNHQMMEGRAIVKEASLEEYEKNHHAGNENHHDNHSLWKEHKKNGSFWGMVIDLNSCTGCSACVIACQAENNIPTVGQEEVARNRELFWLRIDRYYTSTDENPDVVQQPMLCQHCENAPCETVCPTLATVHSSDGLNMQAYNRCVGTRYCANNCPYKVRRFNWFNYSHSDLLANMVLNPDVVVRSRGIMEKCSMCVQRIQEKERLASTEKRSVIDGEIQTACQQSCPADAITFGNQLDGKSQVVKLKKNPRNYRVIDEIKTLPVVSYLTKIRNRKGHEA